jgi:RND family efflux transporter MFP subunit
MKKILSIIFVTIALAACNSGESGEPTNELLVKKQEELTKLKAEQAKILGSIQSLEDEIQKLDPSKAIKPKLVGVSEISPEGFASYINLQGSVTSENISYVAPRNGVGGYVKNLYIKEGQLIKKGQLVLKLDDQVQRQAIQGTRTQLEFAKNIYERNKNLWDQKIGTEVQLLSAKNNVESLQNQIAIQEEQLKTFLVYADQGGIADIVNIKVGELFTGVGPMGPQIQIVNNNDLSVDVDVPENYAGSVKPGTEVEIIIPSLDKTFKTSIARISQSINASSRGFTATCKIPSVAGLKPNMAASVKILNRSNSKAIVVPVNVVQSDENGKYIYVMESKAGKTLAKKKAVTIGDLYIDQIEILSGIQPGDQIVIRGYQDLYEGQLLSKI